MSPLAATTTVSVVQLTEKWGVAKACRMYSRMAARPTTGG